MKIKLIIILVIGVAYFYFFKSYAETVKDKHCFTTQISSKIFDFNTFGVQVSDELERTDFQVINQNSCSVIFENGESQKGIKNDYGYCIFDLYYKGEKVFEIGHFKKNNWVTNNYLLKLEMVGDTLKPSLEITGKHASYDDYFVNRSNDNEFYIF